MTCMTRMTRMTRITDVCIASIMQCLEMNQRCPVCRASATTSKIIKLFLSAVVQTEEEAKEDLDPSMLGGEGSNVMVEEMRRRMESARARMLAAEKEKQELESKLKKWKSKAGKSKAQLGEMANKLTHLEISSTQLTETFKLRMKQLEEARKECTKLKEKVAALEIRADLAELYRDGEPLAKNATDPLRAKSLAALSEAEKGQGGYSDVKNQAARIVDAVLTDRADMISAVHRSRQAKRDAEDTAKNYKSKSVRHQSRARALYDKSKVLEASLAASDARKEELLRELDAERAKVQDLRIQIAVGERLASGAVTSAAVSRGGMGGGVEVGGVKGVEGVEGGEGGVEEEEVFRVNAVEVITDSSSPSPPPSSSLTPGDEGGRGGGGSGGKRGWVGKKGGVRGSVRGGAKSGARAGASSTRGGAPPVFKMLDPHAKSLTAASPGAGLKRIGSLAAASKSLSSVALPGTLKRRRPSTSLSFKEQAIAEAKMRASQKQEPEPDRTWRTELPPLKRRKSNAHPAPAPAAAPKPKPITAFFGM